ADAGDPSPQDLAEGLGRTGFFLPRHGPNPAGPTLAAPPRAFIPPPHHTPARATGEGDRPGRWMPRPVSRGWLPPAVMPVVPPPPRSVVITAPMHLIDRLIEVGSVGDGNAACRRGQARRHAHKADAQADQCCDEDCTHF